MSLVWERAPYSEGSLLVLLALADWADDNGVSWPSVPKLAHKARLQRRRVQYIIRKLQADGFLDIEEGGGRKKQHRYTLNLQKLKGAFIAPFIKGALDDAETVHFGAETVHSATQRAHPGAPDPLVDPLEEPSLDPPYSGDAFIHALRLFKEHRQRMKKPLTKEAERLMYRKVTAWGERSATQALEDAVINRWQGVFEPRHNNGNGHAGVSRVDRSMDAVKSVLAEIEHG